MGAVRRPSSLVTLPAVVPALVLALGLTGCGLPSPGGGAGDPDDVAALRAAAEEADAVVREVAPAVTEAIPEARWVGLSSDLPGCGGGGGDLSSVRYDVGGDVVAPDISLDAVTAVLEDAGLDVAREDQTLEATRGAVELDFVRVPTRGAETVGRLAVTSGCASPGDSDTVESLVDELRVDLAAELDLPRLRG